MRHGYWSAREEVDHEKHISPTLDDHRSEARRQEIEENPAQPSQCLTRSWKGLHMKHFNIKDVNTEILMDADSHGVTGTENSIQERPKFGDSMASCGRLLYPQLRPYIYSQIYFCGR